jgi:hypothetical protein
MEDVGIFYGHSVNFSAIWYILRPILWPFCIISPVLVYIFLVFGMLHKEKSGNPVAHPSIFLRACKSSHVQKQE